MTTYDVSRPQRTDQRWAVWAALVLGLMFLALGAPLAMQTQDAGTVQAERALDARANG
jgi:hypothetical protein